MNEVCVCVYFLYAEQGKNVKNSYICYILWSATVDRIHEPFVYVTHQRKIHDCHVTNTSGWLKTALQSNNNNNDNDVVDDDDDADDIVDVKVVNVKATKRNRLKHRHGKIEGNKSVK